MYGLHGAESYLASNTRLDSIWLSQKFSPSLPGVVRCLDSERVRYGLRVQTIDVRSSVRQLVILVHNSCSRGLLHSRLETFCRSKLVLISQNLPELTRGHMCGAYDAQDRATYFEQPPPNTV